MKTPIKVVAVSTTLALLGGCASGGGSGGSSSPPPESNSLICFFVPIACLFAQSGAGSPTGSAASTSAAFTTWAELERGKPTVASGLGVRSTYESGTDGIIRRTDAATASGASVTYDPAGAVGNLAALGQPGIERHSTAIFANPYALGWNFQSFGAWNEQPSAGSGVFAASSFGQATPGSAVPTSGTATFTGKAGGLYVSPTGQAAIAASDLTVKADFSSRSLGLATSGTTIASDLRAPSAAPHLDVAGTLSYAPGSSRFSGTLTSAGGTLRGQSNGQFYGPAAQELGGAFSLKSGSTVETFTGAYGAKR